MGFRLGSNINHQVFLLFKKTSGAHHGSLYYQPKQCIAIREIPQNYHKFVLFDSPQMGNSMFWPNYNISPT